MYLGFSESSCIVSSDSPFPELIDGLKLLQCRLQGAYTLDLSHTSCWGVDKESRVEMPMQMAFS